MLTLDYSCLANGQTQMIDGRSPIDYYCYENIDGMLRSVNYPDVENNFSDIDGRLLAVQLAKNEYRWRCSIL